MIEIDDLLGIKYRYNGRSKETGFDCLGLAIEVSKRFGHEIPDIEEAMKDDRDFLECEALCVARAKVKKIESPEEEGDVILLRGTDGMLNHIGIYLGNGRFIHCNKLGVHVDKVSQYEILIGRCYGWQ